MPLLPRPYPDEVVGSVVARACWQSGLPLKRLLSDVFGSQRSYHSFLMTSDPCRVGMLSGIEPERVLLEHTVFPYAVAFMERDVQTALMRKALSASSETCLSSLTKNVSHGVPFLRLCPACIKSDLATHGESYWHRSHLLPGALVCLKHGYRLRSTTLRLRGRTQTSSTLLPHLIEPSATSPAVVGKVSEGLLYAISVQSVKALNGEVEVQADWRQSYREQAIRLGYQLAAGDVAGEALTCSMRSLFGSQVLADAGCAFEVGTRGQWPALMVRTGTDLPYASPKHVFLRTLLDSGRPAPLDVTATYAKPGKKRRDYGRMDTRAAAKLQTRIRRAREQNVRVTVKALLTDAGVLAPFKHQRQLFPKTTAVLQEFRYSGQAERQLGGRPYWRLRQPGRFGPTAAQGKPVHINEAEQVGTLT
jgi:hypothetical protein